ncbi:MAG: hypothetical protein PHE43_04345 [Candidatus Nanoarchaeia archaeon]|nr:hypothetical protein [Candidatus Nanoarchaeia archaeon]
MEKEKRGISKNQLAVILVVIIIISSVGTFMALKNHDNVKTFNQIEPTPTGKVGMHVNPVSKEDIKEGENEGSIK